jgi:hypothetical protein
MTFAGVRGYSDQDRANEVGEGMMGNGAMAEDKHELGTRLEMIGWTFDLRTFSEIQWISSA